MPERAEKRTTADPTLLALAKTADDAASNSRHSHDAAAFESRRGVGESECGKLMAQMHDDPGRLLAAAAGQVHIIRTQVAWAVGPVALVLSDSNREHP